MHPDKIILFGSYAYGKPTVDSDIDLLVIMESDQRPIERTGAVSDLFAERHFGMDILVRTPEELAERLAMGDDFLREITSRGKVLYARQYKRMGSQSRKRLPGSSRSGKKAQRTAAGQRRIRLRPVFFRLM